MFVVWCKLVGGFVIESIYGCIVKMFYWLVFGLFFVVFLFGIYMYNMKVFL